MCRSVSVSEERGGEIENVICTTSPEQESFKPSNGTLGDIQH